MPNFIADYLVLGSGVAGLSFALKASENASVTILCKDLKNETSTNYAQGGIASVISKEDTIHKHVQDTLTAGAGLCDEGAVEILVKEGSLRVQELISEGIKFTQNDTGQLHLGREGGHRENRIVHAHDSTGKVLQDFLLDRISKRKNITIIEKQTVIDLITEHHAPSLKEKDPPHTCFGAYVLDNATGTINSFFSKFTILATGGAGHVYPYTTNPSVTSGDGIAIAYRAGCRIRNIEFVQFHPTSLYGGKIDGRSFLITEALRGFGAKLRLKNGKTFMQNYHELKELAPRDVVARAIDMELKKSGDEFIYLDVTHKNANDIKEEFPLIYETLLKKFHINITQEMIPVVPAAHYLCGGVMVDYNSATRLNGLYAIGEVASTGIHGGNRLASNSLLEGLVFGHRAALHSCDVNIVKTAETKRMWLKEIPEWDKGGTENLEELVYIRHDREELQKLMWDLVGIVRSDIRLDIALRRIDLIYNSVIDYYQRTTLSRELLELRNQVLVSQLIVRSAKERKESRGLHFSTDYAENRNPSRKDTILESSAVKSSKDSKLS